MAWRFTFSHVSSGFPQDIRDLRLQLFWMPATVVFIVESVALGTQLLRMTLRVRMLHAEKCYYQHSSLNLTWSAMALVQESVKSVLLKFISDVIATAITDLVPVAVKFVYPQLLLFKHYYLGLMQINFKFSHFCFQKILRVIISSFSTHDVTLYQTMF